MEKEITVGSENRKESLLTGEIHEVRKQELESKGTRTGGMAESALGWMDRTYLLISAIQKAIRWGEVNDARFFAQELIGMGMPGGVFNRLLIISAEDVGFADPTLVKYVRDQLGAFETMLKDLNIKKKEVSSFPEIRAVVDRAVIAAALSYKSRLLPMLLFATLFEIHRKEDFSREVGEYRDRFHSAVLHRDEREAAYHACILAFFLDSEGQVIDIARQESETRELQPIVDEWTQAYRRSKERLMLIGIVTLLCRDVNYPHGEYRDQVAGWLSTPIDTASIPDRAYDMHTRAGKKKGRGLEHFFNEAASVNNERFPNDWKESGENAYYQAREEGIERAAKIIEAIKERVKRTREGTSAKEFLRTLPFEYKRAVLTQARTCKNKPFAFIVEFHDGSRKFVKGPFQNIEAAEDHIRYNEVKRRLESKYLHPIHCELMRKDTGVFLVCDEIGKADLNQVEERETTLDGRFEVLSYEPNDVVPDPLKYLEEINNDNEHVWIGLMVNYCFRWIFGLGDSARRNLMLEKTNGRIYSTDEIFLRSSSHDEIWGGQKPAKEKFDLIRGFAESGLLGEVLAEVSRWKACLDDICREVTPISEEVQRRIDQLLENPERVLGLISSQGEDFLESQRKAVGF